MATVSEAKYEEEFAKLCIEGPETIQPLESATSSRNEGFSDKVVLALANKLAFPSYASQRQEMKRILIRFFIFYFNGTIDVGDNIAATLNDVIAIARTHSGDLWREEKFTVNTFYTRNSSNVTVDSLHEFGTLPRSQAPAAIPAGTERNAYLALMNTYTSQHVQRFMDTVKIIIAGIQETGAATVPELELRQLAGFLALTLYRFATKNKEQMSNAFSKKRYQTKLTQVAGWPINKYFSPPSVLCLETCSLGLKKGQKNTSHVFTLLTAEFIITRKEDFRKNHVARHLLASVLTHTAGNGVELIEMLRNVSEITALGWCEVRKRTFSNQTREAWRTFANFFTSQQSIGNRQVGYHWAQIIDDRYFRGLSPKEQPFLACIFAGVICNVQGAGVWQAKWAKTYAKGYEDARQLGIQLFNDTRVDNIQPGNKI